jgi:hypothetical protein
LRERESILVVGFLVIALAAVGVLLWSEERRLLDDPQAKAERGEIVGAEGDSLVRSGNFARAMGEIGDRMGEGAVITSLRASPVRVDATTRDPTGKQRILAVDPGFDVETRDFGEGSQPGVRAAAIDTAAPERFVLEVQRRAPAEPENLDYLVYSVSAGSAPRWLLFLDGVPLNRKQWEADSRGGDVRRLGEPSGNEAQQSRCLEQARSAEEAARCQGAP